MSSSPSGVDAAPEEPRPGAPPAIEAPSSHLPEQGRPPLPPGPAPVAPNGHTGHPGNRRLRKKIVAPAVMVIIGVGLLLGAIALYSSPGEPSSPPYPTLQLHSTFPLSNLIYTVDQVQPALARITVEAEMPAGTVRPPASAPVAHLFVALPRGTTFWTCPNAVGLARVTRPWCSHVGSLSIWVQPLVFRTIRGPFASYGAAFTTVFVRARSFGVHFNDVTASAAIPAIEHDAAGVLVLTAQYNIPSASSYDWSAFPTLFANGTYAMWDEQVPASVADGKAAIGVNHANQAKDANMTFIAGALLGLAGAAFLVGIQEALHIND